MKKIFYVFGVIAMAVALGGTAKATVVSPPLLELDANRGDQLANTIKLKNDGTVAETYYLSTQAFKAAGEDGKPQFTDDKSDIVSWISFQFTNVTLQPGQAITIPFTLSVPATATAGGHYAAVFATTTPPSVEGTGVGIQARIGTLILVKIAGETVESARIAEFSTDKDSYSMLPVNFNIRVENSGNVHLKPFGEIVVRNFWGNEATRLKVNEEGGNVLPNSMRKYTTAWGSASTAEGFWARYTQERQDHAFGKYTAELTLAYAEGKALKSQISFWVVPVERIIVNLIILIILVIILVFAIRKYNEWVVVQYRDRSTGKSMKK